jgi:uncharacterized protein
METPCNKICVIDPMSGLCRGCGRTAEEIARWTAMTDTERRDIMDALAARMVAAGLSRP